MKCPGYEIEKGSYTGCKAFEMGRMDNILKVVQVWLDVESDILKKQEDGSWTHGVSYGKLKILYQIKELLSCRQAGDDVPVQGVSRG